MARGKTLAASRIRHNIVDRPSVEISHDIVGGLFEISHSNTNSWSAVKDILLDVIEMDEQTRVAFLNSTELDDDVRSELISLLEYSNANADFLDTPAIAFSKDAILPVSDAENGRTIGSYTIERELGLGGMGAVYLASRSDGKFNQQVALKLLRREYAAGKTREAFQREIDIQSALVHPNIARILDTGTTDDGIPYIAMEFVEGEPIDEFCFKHKLSLRDRLKLFNKACEGVAFAHSNLVIHRDIKPSNILVTADGTPKLIDFGISKLADADDSVPTLFGAMTPEYASPEQIDGQPVTTATDIYSLAVVLYKLLAGRLPFDLNAVSASGSRRLIVETEPPRPSLATSDRGISSAELSGDLDNIILKALQKDARERYQTVEQFADDIWRSMDGLPVRARPSTLGYRAAKFVRRNRIAVAAAIVVALSLIAGIAMTAWQSRVAMAESANARSEQAKSEKMSKYMAKIIGYANPGWYAEGAKQKGEARVIDAVNDLADKIDTDFPDDIDIAAELHYRFAEVYGWIGRSKPAGPEREPYSAKYRHHSLRALELRTKYYGQWHVLVAKDLYNTYGLLSDDPYEQCRIFDRAINMMRATDPTNRNFPFMLTDYAAFISYLDDHPRTVPCRQTVTPQTNESQHEIAIRYYREAQPYLTMHFPEGGGTMAYVDCRLGVSLAKLGKRDEASSFRSKCQAYVDSTSDDAERKLRITDLEKIDAALAEFSR